MSSARTGFAGTTRFRILERLGAGGMGLVYRAFDDELGIDVALKTLLEVDAASIYRFKQEFRALADVAHPNLVSLYELVSERDEWFFTMELIDGSDFVSHQRGDAFLDTIRTPGLLDHTRETFTNITQLTMPTRPSPLGETRKQVKQQVRAAGPVDYDVLRDRLGQLAEGVCALHDSGHLHRDIKPSNVLVTPQGRVVLLDFGVVAELAGSRRTIAETEVVGTPMYMAPEQAAGEHPTEASDWYSVGIMLYDLLVGRPPFTGNSRSVLRQKQFGEPPPPRLSRPDVPDDLDDLCGDLLRAEPEVRPKGHEVLARLGRTTPLASRSRAIAAKAANDGELIGRDAQMTALREAFEQARSGRGATVYVHGVSGMGKSTLVRRFLDDVDRRGNAVVLEGRCYERESVPYKAVDSLVDSLCRYLLSLSRRDGEQIIPPGVAALARVFPVLRRVDAIAEADEPQLRTPNPQELRLKAFTALRALLTNLAGARPLVLYVDDLQWGDVDSAQLLHELMRPPNVPPVLLLGCYRTDEADRSPLLSAMFSREQRLSESERPTRISVGALPEDDARSLAKALLNEVGSGSEAAARIARESAGSPFFIHELVQYLRSDNAAGAQDNHSLSLDAVIRARIDRLPDNARRLVEVIAVAGKPIAPRIAEEAADLSDAVRLELIQLLKTEHLVRVSGSDLVESYHDRIRETVSASLTEQALADAHRRLAFAIESSDVPDAETLATHFAAAGEIGQARLYAISAAGEATDALAFDRAAQLYRRALDLGSDEDSDRQSLTRRLGDALLNAGRGADAARAYLEAAELSEAAEALDLRRLAGEQFLRSGYVDEGIATMRVVLEGVGLSLPKTPWRAIPQLLWHRMRLAIRGLELSERQDEVGEEELFRVDVCYSAATGLSLVDPARAATFSTRNVRLALDAGEPKRAARAMAVEAGFAASEGKLGAKRSKRLADAAMALAKESDDPYAEAMATLGHGFAANQQGRFLENFELTEKARQIFVDQCQGVAWEMHTADLCSLSSLMHQGDGNALAKLTRERLAHARQCGDLYGITNLSCLYMPFVTVSEGDLERAQQFLSEGLAQWSADGFHLQHCFALFVQIQIDIYSGDGVRAYQRCRESHGKLLRSLLLQLQLMKGNWWRLCAASGLAAASQGYKPRKMRRFALRHARRLERDGAPWLYYMGRIMRAGVMSQRGKRDRAIELLQEAISGFEDTAQLLNANAARLGLGQILGGDEGADIRGHALEWFAGQNVADPIRLARAMAPGFPEPDTE